MSELELISPSPDEYRELVTPDILDFPGSVFYEPEFLLTTARYLNLEFNPAVAVSGKKVVGLANYLVRNRKVVKTALIPSLIQYYGPISLSEKPEVYECLLRKLADDKIDLCIFSLTPESSEQFDSTGWRTKPRLTFYLETNSYDKLYDGCVPNCKNKVNKALKNDIDVIETDKIPIDIYFQTFNRRNMKPPISLGTLNEWSEKLYELGLLKTFVARRDSIFIAFRSVFYYGGYAYNWVSGVIPEAFKYGVSNLLMLKTAESLYKDGIKHYDLVGGDIQTIAEFKKSFGSKPVEHLQVERAYSLRGKVYRGLMKLKAEMNE